MKLLTTVCMVVVLTAAATGFAAAGDKYKSPKDACLRGVEDVSAAYAERDIGEKASIQVEKLIQISAHLCEQGNFAYAKELQDMARSMLATE